MKDSRGISLGHRDIVARRTDSGWRISRVALVGYSDPTKTEPLAVCIDFETHGIGTSWLQVTDPNKLQRIARNSDLSESAEELVKRMPGMGKLLNDFELHELNFKLTHA